MRVAVDVTPLRGAVTGVGQTVAGLLGALPAAAPEVTVVPWELTRRRAFVPPSLLVRRWAVADRPSGRWLLPPADVVHGSNFVVPPAARPAVVTVHDLWCARRPDACHPTVAAAVATVRRAVARGAWVHVTTDWGAEEAREVLGAERLAVVPFAAPAVPAAGPPPVDGPYVLAIGTVDPRKGFDTLARAAAAAGLHLVLAGAEGPAEPAVTEAVAATGAMVTRLREVDDSTRAALLRGAAVLAYPSRYEGFGLPPLEAMSVGVPVVATRCGGVPEVVGDAALLVDVDDVDAMAAALTSAMGDATVRSRLVTAGYARAAAFDWAGTARGLAELWKTALEAA